MARKPKEYKTTAQKLADIKNEIKTTEEKLTMLKQEKKELESLLEQEKVAALLDAIQAKNISIDEAKDIIDGFEIKN